MFTPGQTVWLVMAETVGVGFTVIVKVAGAPPHVLPEGVTVMVPVAGDVPVFMAVKAAMLPVPVDARPIVALLFAQV